MVRRPLVPRSAARLHPLSAESLPVKTTQSSINCRPRLP